MSEEHTDDATGIPEDDDAASVAHHDPATHMDAHTTIDWGAWAVAVVSGAAGLLVAALFWVAVN